MIPEDQLPFRRLARVALIILVTAILCRVFHNPGLWVFGIGFLIISMFATNYSDE